MGFAAIIGRCAISWPSLRVLMRLIKVNGPRKCRKASAESARRKKAWPGLFFVQLADQLFFFSFQLLALSLQAGFVFESLFVALLERVDVDRLLVQGLPQLLVLVLELRDGLEQLANFVLVFADLDLVARGQLLDVVVLADVGLELLAQPRQLFGLDVALGQHVHLGQAPLL